MSVVMCLIALLLAGPLPGAAKPDPREQLDTAIAEGIRLLEAKDNKGFVSAFVPPNEIEKRGGIEMVTQRFSDSRAVVLLAALKDTQQAKPVMEAGGTIAAFTLQPMAGRPDTLRFQKIGKFWYIAN